MGGDDDDLEGGLSDEDLARLLDPDLASESAIREPTAGERAQQMIRAARRADLERRLHDEALRKEREAQEQRRQARREKGGRASRRRARVVIGVLLVAALLASVAAALLRRGDRSSDETVATKSSTASTVPRPDGYPPATKEASKPLGTPPALPTATAPYEFLRTQPHSQEPVTWDPCRPIRYVVNPAGSPTGGLELIQSAVARTADATGLHFEYEGTTDETWTKDRESYQPDRYGREWAPALIAWGTQQDVPGLAGYIAGLSSGDPRSDLKDPDRQVYVSGTSVLDSDDIGQLLTQGRQPVAQAIVQHEMGHLVGLDHVADPSQLMYSEASPQVTDWGVGDLRGLHALGSGDCTPDI
jgi:hypothetical protein